MMMSKLMAMVESPMMMDPEVPIPPPKSDIGSAGHSDGRSVSTASFERAPSSNGPAAPQRASQVHGRESSFDRNWTLGMKSHKASDSSASGRRFTGDSGFASQSSWSAHHANESRNYMSTGEDGSGGKRDRNVLHKRGGSSGSHGNSHNHHHFNLHGKKSSYTEEQRTRSGNNTPTPTSTPTSPIQFPNPPIPPPAPAPAPFHHHSPHHSPSHSQSSMSPAPRGVVVSKQTFHVSERAYETSVPAPAPRIHSHLARDSVAYSNVPPGYSSPSPASIVYHNTVKGRKRSTSEAQIMSLDSRARESIAASVMPGGKTLSVERPPPQPDEKHVPPNIMTKANHPHRSASEGAEKAMSPLSQDTNSTLLSPNGSEHSNSIRITIDTPERKSDESKQRNGNAKDKDKKLRSVASASGIRQKSKKQNTSAYLEGLKEVTPADAAADADFSGWMKKRGSSAVVATWKTRFFVLKGRRLSYFYSMDDTKERGLIDITSHRVLPAADDRLVALHASVAAITSSTPASQASSANPGNGTGSSVPTTPPASHKGGWFTFKLVPPAPGAAKGVMFTPPKLHYFATDSKQVGREWMAAFMKATIDRDETAPVISTFSANTISLAKARAMRARPPGFGDSNTEPKPTPIIGLPIMSGQGSFNDSIESALAERNLIDDDAANAADDER
ncbi:hypothetical protein AA313_de0209729 [Arthrobotrys entomopaga]|nr:hypothetical protein AA313_de0209729 [Arthrobotrys entomopaga]